MKSFVINLIIILVLAGISIPLAINALQGSQNSTYKIRSSAQSQSIMTFIFTSVKLHGIGSSGDNMNSDSSRSNKDPFRRNKNITVNIYNTSNNLQRSVQGTILYNESLGAYKGDIEIGSPLATGNYIIKIKVDSYLQRSLGTIRITSGTDPTMPQATLVAGDLNGDNVLNITDLNILLGCYEDIFPASFCNQTRGTLADLSSDDQVNQLDYNLFLRELDVQHGD